jgi:hypothetical protein
MRAAGWILAALVAGFLLGGIQPRRALADLEEEHRQLEQELKEARKKAARSGSRPRTLNIPGVGDIYTPPPAADTGGAEPAAGGRREAGQQITEIDGAAGDPGGRPSAADLPADELDLAVDAQRLRAAQARAAFIEQAELSDDEIDAFDAIIDRMNGEFAAMSQEIVEVALSGEEPLASDLMALTHDVTGVLLDAQSDLEDLVGVDTVAGMDESTGAAWNYIDLESLRDATLDLQDQLE